MTLRAELNVLCREKFFAFNRAEQATKGTGLNMTKVSKAFMARQGDVLLLQIHDVDPSKLAVAHEDGAPLLAKRAGDGPRTGLWIASGESSGHEHRVFGRGAKLFRFRDTANTARVLVVGRSGADLRVVGGESGGVPRHHPVQLPSGKYEVRVQRTWTAADDRSANVAD